MKNRINKICIITSSYPTPNNPVSTFVDQLVCAWADMGLKCIVISPQNILSAKRNLNPLVWERVTKKGNIIKIHSPRYVSVSNKKILGLSSSHLTYRNFRNAVDSVIRSNNYKFDCLYGHFIFPSGLTAAVLGSKYNIPSFLAFGESSTKNFEHFGLEKASRILKELSGIVSVSNENKKRLIDLNIIQENNIDIKVFPNAIDNSVFYKRDKVLSRERLGYKHDDFIIAFVGHYIHRKGPLRVSKAIEKLNNVKSIFIGEGPEEPTCNGILHKGRVPHEQIPEMLSAADVFVLPTLNEGCCNAIIEAMACGLPIVSSNGPFNDDILWDDNSIRVDPNNIDEIKEAIELLKNNDQKREEMSNASLKHASNLKIEARAQNILKFIMSNIS